MAKFENYFSSRAALFKISDDNAIISAKQKKIGPFDAFDQIFCFFSKEKKV
jgi:hypothetical protein